MLYTRETNTDKGIWKKDTGIWKDISQKDRTNKMIVESNEWETLHKSAAKKIYSRKWYEIATVLDLQNE